MIAFHRDNGDLKGIGNIRQQVKMAIQPALS
jgi:hypothetical protein